MKVAVHGYHAGKAWLCICVGVEPPFSKSWIRHCLCMKDCQHMRLAIIMMCTLAIAMLRVLVIALVDELVIIHAQVT